MNLNQTPAEKADELLKLLIQHQPDIIKVPNGTPTESDGKASGDFIAGLRARLIDMYNLTPRG